MRTIVKTKDIELTSALTEYLDKELDKIRRLLKRAEKAKDKEEARQGREPFTARIELGRTTQHHKKGQVFRAEINLAVPGNEVLRAEAKREDLRTALTEACDELTRVIKEWKGKRTTLRRKGAREAKRKMRGLE